jgi:hypothetical protein
MIGFFSLCLKCELDITELLGNTFYKDPAQKEFQVTCPRCKLVMDVDVIPVPTFGLSVPVGRLGGVA